MESADLLVQVRGWIEARGLSIEDAARRVGIPADELERALDAGERGPPLQLVLRILDGLDLRLAGVEASTPAEIVRSLEALQAAKGLSNRALAGAAGVDRSNLNKLLTSKAPDPRFDTVIKLAKVLGLELRIEARGAGPRLVPEPIDVADVVEPARSEALRSATTSPPAPEPVPVSTFVGGVDLADEDVDHAEDADPAEDGDPADEVADLRAEIEDLKRRLDLAEVRSTEHQRERDASREAMAELQARHSDAAHEVATIRADLTASRRENEDLRRQRDEAEERRAHAAKELGATVGMSQRLAAAERELARLRDQSPAQATRIKELSDALTERDQALVARTRERDEATKARDGAEARNAALTGELAEMRTKQGATERKLSHALESNRRKNAEIAVQRRYMRPVDQDELDAEVDAFFRDGDRR